MLTNLLSNLFQPLSKLICLLSFSAPKTQQPQSNTTSPLCYKHPLPPWSLLLLLILCLLFQLPAAPLKFLPLPTPQPLFLALTAARTAPKTAAYLNVPLFHVS